MASPGFGAAVVHRGRSVGSESTADINREDGLMLRFVRRYHRRLYSAGDLLPLRGNRAGRIRTADLLTPSQTR